jgi:hypothetical protein
LSIAQTHADVPPLGEFELFGLVFSEHAEFKFGARWAYSVETNRAIPKFMHISGNYGIVRSMLNYSTKVNCGITHADFTVLSERLTSA